MGAAVRDRAALESGSSGETFVAMVKTADLRNRNHLAAVWQLNGTSIRAVFVERQMCPRAVIVIDVRRQDAAQMALVDHEYVIQALATNRADDALDVGILPGRSWRRNDLRDPHRLSALAKALTIRSIAIAQQVAWRGVPRKRFGDLARKPTCSRMLCDIQMQNLPSRVAKTIWRSTQNSNVYGAYGIMSSYNHLNLLEFCARRLRVER
jgi:hypothetical protein